MVASSSCILVKNPSTKIQFSKLFSRSGQMAYMAAFALHNSLDLAEKEIHFHTTVRPKKGEFWVSPLSHY